MSDRCTLAHLFGEGYDVGAAYDNDFRGIYWSTFRDSIQLKQMINKCRSLISNLEKNVIRQLNL